MNHSTSSEPQAPARGLLKFATPVLIIAAVGVTLWVNAGDLNPPPGPVTSTLKTLVEVEPRIAINENNTPGDADSLFKITASGSYYLTGNIDGVPGKKGIEITADNVTLDLNGFALVGAPGSLAGVAVPAAQANLDIRNGTVRGWGTFGVGAFNATNSRLKDLRASGNALDGLIVGAGNSTVSGCTAVNNGAGGIAASGGSTIISNCTARNNAGNGVSGGIGAVITNCTAMGNSATGISADKGSTVKTCTARSNSGFGIWAGTGSTVTDCTSSFNGADGINVRSYSTISGCTASDNANDGIEASSHSRIVDNNCVNNRAGIHISSGDNRIEGNNVSGNDRGIDVDDQGNVIIKNTASGNTTNYDIVAGNSYGAIVNVGGVGDISGTANADHPWANFEY